MRRILRIVHRGCDCGRASPLARPQAAGRVKCAGEGAGCAVPDGEGDFLHEAIGRDEQCLGRLDARAREVVAESCAGAGAKQVRKMAGRHADRCGYRLEPKRSLGVVLLDEGQRGLHPRRRLCLGNEGAQAGANRVRQRARHDRVGVRRGIAENRQGRRDDAACLRSRQHGRLAEHALEPRHGRVEPDPVRWSRTCPRTTKVELHPCHGRIYRCRGPRFKCERRSTFRSRHWCGSR